MSFNQPIGNWNTSKVTNMSALFFRNPAFNQDIGTKAVTKNNVTYTAWNTSEVTDMSFMFGSGVVAVGVLVPVGSFTNGNSDSIKNWNTSKVTLMNSMFAQQNFFNHDVGTKVVTVNGNTYTAWDVSNVTNMSFMFNAFLNIGNATGVFNNGGSDSIKNWNTSKVTTLQAFCQRQALFNQDVGTKVVTVGANTYTAWDTLNVTNMSSTFSVTSTTTTGSFNNGGSDSIKNWNISKVTTINSIFYGQVLFNQDVSTKRVTVGASTYTAWDTLNVTIMTGPFFINTGTSTGQFNQPIGNWNTSKVTNMQSFAYNQPLFNQDVSTKVITVGPSTYTAWDTLNVTNMSFMFGMVTSILGNFNQNIGNWNTSKVTTISSMFQNQPLFNQDISTKRVTVGASTYTAWDTLNVTNMSFMVSISPGNQGQFNQNIGNWNTSKVTTLASTFTNQPAFNQDISTKTVTVGPSTYTAWNTSEVTSMRFTLYNNLANTASQFNQNIGNWNTSKVTDMNAMLFNTTNFNQNLGTWNVSLVTVFDDVTFGGFAEQSGLSQTNYDALLIGWASRPVLANKAINFGTTKYSSAAVAARVILTSAPNNWTIIDGGQI
jgi:surface protein